MSYVLGRLAFALLFLIVATSFVGLGMTELETPPADRPYSLSLPDLSSPRATLLTLIANGNTVEREIFAHGTPWELSPATRRMISTVNTENLSPARRELNASLAAARLKDVTEHLVLPPADEIPDAAVVRAHNIGEWRLPGTAIVIAKVTTGPRAGQFLFSPETVADSGELYEAASTLPYTAGRGANLYEEFRYMPGPMFPRAAIAALPAALRLPVFGQALWQWAGLVLLLVTSFICMIKMIGWGIRHDRGKSGAWRRWGQPAMAFAIFVLSGYTMTLVYFGLHIWGGFLEIIEFAFEFIALAALAWLVITLILRVCDMVITAFTMRESSIDAQLVKIIGMLLAIGVGIGTVFLAAEFAGVPVGPLLGGLGIGGVAVALAVRPTLENVIGGLTLFADRPARVGEFCQIGAQEGTIEEIGLRTTKIRRRDDTLVTISNAELAQARIENQSRRRKRLFDPVLRLRYDTSMAQFQQVTTALEKLLESDERLVEGTGSVRLKGIGDYALELEILAQIGDQTDVASLTQELNLSILAVVRDAGIGLAYPSQTNYLVDRRWHSTPDEQPAREAAE